MVAELHFTHLACDQPKHVLSFSFLPPTLPTDRTHAFFHPSTTHPHRCNTLIKTSNFTHYYTSQHSTNPSRVSSPEHTATMRYPRNAHNTGAQKKTSPIPDKPTGIKKKTLSAQNKPSSAAKKTPSAAKDTLVAQNNSAGTQNDTLAATAQDDQPVSAEEVPKERNGLADSPLNQFPPELRLSIIKRHMPRLRRIAIIPKSLTQQADATPTTASNEPSLVFTTRNPFLKTCYQLHTEYTSELRSSILRREIPTLILHVHNFDFSPLTRELFSSFEDRHREYFNDRAGAIRIRLTITKSFFTRPWGEVGLINWLEARESEQTGLKQWLGWKQAEEEAGRAISVAYEVKREQEIENVDDMETLRLFMLLFDPYSRAGGEIGDIVQAFIEFFQKVARSRKKAQNRNFG